MNTLLTKKVVSLIILFLGLYVGIWTARLLQGISYGTFFVTAAWAALPFVLLALTARFIASWWLSLLVVLLTAAGAAWLCFEAYPDVRHDAQGGVMLIFLPIVLCEAAGIAAVLVLLSEVFVRTRAWLVSTDRDMDPQRTARQVLVARWLMAMSAVFFMVIAGACLHKITQEVLCHREAKTVRKLTSQEQRRTN